MKNLVPVNAEIIKVLSKEISSEIFSILDDKYKFEPRGTFQNTAIYIAKPKNTLQVSQIMNNANNIGFGVVPYSGGSGLVCGQISIKGQPLLLSLERLNKIREFNPVSGVVKVEAGVVLSDLKKISEAHNRQFPLSLASQGSCMIGGNLATNAGGVNVLKYGNARDLCYGLEVVMPDGKILNDLNDLKKDNSGYDIKNLIIGSEGTLGVITAASLKTFPLTNNLVALISVNTSREAIKLYSFLSSKLEFSLQAFELISTMGIKFLMSTGLIKTFPISTSKDWWLLVEVGSAGQGDLIELFQKLLSQAVTLKMIDEIVISQNSKQYDDIWKIRELIPEANRLVGSVSNHDISLPLNKISDFIEKASIEILEVSEDLRINCFGHIGDGNLHYNIFPPAGKSKYDYRFREKEIKEKVNNLVSEFKGSISAEHGIGRLKRQELYRYSDPIKLDLMKSIKDLFDPNGVLNPGAIFLE